MPAADSPVPLELLRVEEVAQVDDRWRMALPKEFHHIVQPWGGAVRLVKHQRGAIGLWAPRAEKETAPAHDEVDRAIDEALRKRREDKPTNQALLQAAIRLARLRSTRETVIHFQSKYRITIPESFRTFLGIEPKSDVFVVASAVCIEIWHPERWREFVDQEMGNLGLMIDSALGN